MKTDLIIIGGGVMGLMTAYFASKKGLSVIMVEKNVIGPKNKKAASFSLSRSIHSGYVDPFYAKLAIRSRQLWRDLELESDKQLVISCSCLNIASNKISPDRSQTYAYKTYETLKRSNIAVKMLDGKQLSKAYPQFKADYASLDINGGVADVTQVTEFLLKKLAKARCRFILRSEVVEIQEADNVVTVVTKKESILAKSLVITVGIETDNVLSLVKNNKLRIGLFPSRPFQSRYIVPSNLSPYSSDKMPVFAYLDVGIYGHPWIEGRTKGLKIGYYSPPQIKKKDDGIRGIDDFINECMPELKTAKSVEIKDADQCSYDMTSDNDFVLGRLPSFRNVFVGCGWNGTGYKFAPLVGRYFSEMIVSPKRKLEIKRFDPARFI